MTDQKPEGAGVPDNMSDRYGTMKGEPTDVGKCKNPDCQPIGDKAMSGGNLD